MTSELEDKGRKTDNMGKEIYSIYTPDAMEPCICLSKDSMSSAHMPGTTRSA